MNEGSDKTVLMFDIQDKQTSQQSKVASTISNLYGWLAVTSGDLKGETFKLKALKNYIGRNSEYEIPLLYDKSISRKKCACIEYIPKSSHYVLSNVEFHGYVQHNGQLLTEGVILSKGDLITVGGTELTFIPLKEPSYR